jgi:hypothetical protein
LQDVAVDQVLVVRRDPAAFVASPRLEPAAACPGSEPVAPAHAVTPLALDTSAAERILSELERELARRPESFSIATLYRRRCSELGQHERAVRFFSKSCEENASLKQRVELACALVDQIPTCGGIAAVVSKGRLAKRSLDQLDLAIADHPDSWVAHYCRGMNHLHWPKALRHTSFAIRDLSWCVADQACRFGSQAPPLYTLRTHVALGDAYVKNDEPERARQVWRAAAKLFAGSADLEARLRCRCDQELARFVANERSLDCPIDTGLAFLEGDAAPDEPSNGAESSR